MTKDVLKERLIEAAELIDRSTETLDMRVMTTGIRLTITRWSRTGINERRARFIGWLGLEQARQNPLLSGIRDLINEMDGLEALTP